MDHDLLEDLGVQPRVSKDLLEWKKQIGDKIRDQVFKKEESMKIKVRMKESHFFSGLGRAITGGTVFEIEEKDFDRIHSQCNGKLERLDGVPANPTEDKPKPKADAKAKAEESVTKG